jgi:mono/diheme cytochrome c family protein
MKGLNAVWFALLLAALAPLASFAQTSNVPTPAPAASTPAPAASPTGDLPAPPPEAASEEDRSADTFVNRCSGCHTLGSGTLTGPGPDLLPSTRWPEPDLLAKVKSMEKNAGPISDEDTRALTALMKDAQVSQRLDAARQRAEKSLLTTLDPGSPVIGERLFHGRQSLRNGGPRCASCHAVNGRGGTLAVDLTGVFGRMGETGLVSACEQANFNVMRAVFRGKPVTKQEAVHLAKFFESKANAGPVPGIADIHLAAVGGTVGAVMVMGLLAAALRRRKTGTRARLVRPAPRR